MYALMGAIYPRLKKGSHTIVFLKPAAVGKAYVELAADLSALFDKARLLA